MSDAYRRQLSPGSVVSRKKADTDQLKPTRCRDEGDRISNVRGRGQVRLDGASQSRLTPADRLTPEDPAAAGPELGTDCNVEPQAYVSRGAKSRAAELMQ